MQASTMRAVRTFVITALALLPARPDGVVAAAVRGSGKPAPGNAAPAKELRTGSFQTTFDQRSPLSKPALIGKRIGWNPNDPKIPADDRDYDLAAESFEVYVPESYTGKEPYGLFVWVNPGPGGGLFEAWREVIDKHKLVWLGPNNIGNHRNPICRLGLAIDAAHNAPRHFNIDPDRVYIAGASGGGRVSSMLSIAYPDVFRGGGYFLIGCNYYRSIELPDRRGKFYRKHFVRPPVKFLTEAKKNRKHVFLTGDDDANRQQTELYYNAARKDGFKHVTYVQVPGMGHEAPDAEWFEKGLAALDEPIETARGKKKSRGAPKTADRRH